jgi:hypothetical protein
MAPVAIPQMIGIPWGIATEGFALLAMTLLFPRKCSKKFYIFPSRCDIMDKIRNYGHFAPVYIAKE